MGTNHMADFLASVRTRDKQSLCTIEDGFRSTGTVQLGMIAYESDSTVHWDAAQEQIVDNEPASRLLTRSYRKGFKLPETI